MQVRNLHLLVPQFHPHRIDLILELADVTDRRLVFVLEFGILKILNVKRGLLSPPVGCGTFSRVRRAGPS